MAVIGNPLSDEQHDKQKSPQSVSLLIPFAFDEAITIHYIGLYPVQSDNAPQSGADFSN